jgi:hypothetical protein
MIGFNKNAPSPLPVFITPRTQRGGVSFLKKGFPSKALYICETHYYIHAKHIFDTAPSPLPVFITPRTQRGGASFIISFHGFSYDERID